MESKICTNCNTEKPISEYYVVKKTGYIYTQCRKCHYQKHTKKIAKKWREDNKEKWLAHVSKNMKKYYDNQDSGIYCIFTDKGLYVGKSTALQHRINMHKSTDYPGNVKHKGATYLRHIILAYNDDPKELRKLESYWIKRLRPELNLQENPDYKKGPDLKYVKIK